MQRPIRRFIWWFLLLTILSIVSLLVDSFFYRRPHTSQQITQSPPIQAYKDARMSSSIPSLQMAALHLFINPVDLRRAELTLAVDDHEPPVDVKPLLDKVLMVPKLFTLHRYS